MTMKKLLAEIRELTESVRSCGCAPKLCEVCKANLDRLDFKSRDAEDRLEEEASRYDLRSRSHATARNARNEGVASDNHAEAVLSRGAANALRALLDGPTFERDKRDKPSPPPPPGTFHEVADLLRAEASASPPPRTFWADGRDVLTGEHEADIGIVATCADKEGARAVADLLEHAAGHGDHGRGDGSGPDDPDCPCRGTTHQGPCARAGCGFCLSASTTVKGRFVSEARWTKIKALKDAAEVKLNHIVACVEVWDRSGIGRPKAIERTAEELRALISEAIP